MSTSPLTSFAGDSSTASLFRQRRDDLKTLVAAVQSGNITDAQTALKSYQQDNDSIKSSSAHHHAGSGRNPKLQADFSTLTSAIQAGSITDAQAALKAYQEDRQAPEQASEPPPPADTAKSAFANDFAALVKDALSGDTAAAQNDASALVKDIVELFKESAAKAGLSPAPTAPASDSVAGKDAPPPTSDSSADKTTAGADSDGDTSPGQAITAVLIAYNLNSVEETPQPSGKV